MTTWRRDKSKPDARVKWTKAKVEEIIADIKGGMKQGAAAKKHGIQPGTLTRKIAEYNAGELE